MCLPSFNIHSDLPVFIVFADLAVCNLKHKKKLRMIPLTAPLIEFHLTYSYISSQRSLIPIMDENSVYYLENIKMFSPVLPILLLLLLL